MKITDVRIRTVRLELPTPQSNNRWTWPSIDFSITEVFTDEGIVGFGTGGGIGVNWLILNWAKHVIVGEDPLNYEGIWNKLYTGVPPMLTREALNSGEAIAAISAVDTAIWDIIGKALNQPVYKLLGGARDRVPAYASGGHYTAEGVQELKDREKEMTEYVDAGFNAVKMRVGRFGLKYEAERVRVVRETIGDDVALMLDANWRWTTAPEAIKVHAGSGAVRHLPTRGTRPPGQHRSASRDRLGRRYPHRLGRERVHVMGLQASNRVPCRRYIAGGRHALWRRHRVAQDRRDVPRQLHPADAPRRLRRHRGQRTLFGSPIRRGGLVRGVIQTARRMGRGLLSESAQSRQGRLFQFPRHTRLRSRAGREGHREEPGRLVSRPIAAQVSCTSRRR